MNPLAAVSSFKPYMKVIFFGTPQFAADVLTYLLDNKVDVAAVVTRVDKPKGRSGDPVASPVKQVALEHSLTVHQPVRSSSPEFVEVLASYQADLFVVVAYGEIVKESVLALPKKGCINVHPSLLPKFRGAAPIQQAIIHGETQTGVCIMHMVKEMDAGDVISTVISPIAPDVTYGELEHSLRHLGAVALLDVIHKLEKGAVTATPQDPSQVTFAKKIELEDCQIDWTRDAQDIHNLVRGTNPAPGAWCAININGIPKRLKILKTSVVKTLTGTSGAILSYGKEGLIIACGIHAIRILEVKPEGKRAMPAEDMMRGISKDSFTL
ncbi:MAG: methionyl-tRNA formyltransferase [Chlamydiales bacterium]|nr:methionyl-tRNA formyltransferase [Chlamydiales bacterium]